MNEGGNTLDIRRLGVLASSKDRKFHPPQMLLLLTLWWETVANKGETMTLKGNGGKMPLSINYPLPVPLTHCTGLWTVSSCRWSRLWLHINLLSWLSLQVEPAPWGNRPQVLCDAFSRDALGYRDHFQESGSSAGCPQIPSSYLFGDLFKKKKDRGWLEMLGSQLLPFWRLRKLRSRAVWGNDKGKRKRTSRWTQSWGKLCWRQWGSGWPRGRRPMPATEHVSSLGERTIPGWWGISTEEALSPWSSPESRYFCLGLDLCSALISTLLNLVESRFPAGTSPSQGCKITVLPHIPRSKWWLLLKVTLKCTLPHLPLLTPQHLLLGGVGHKRSLNICSWGGGSQEEPPRKPPCFPGTQRVVHRMQARVPTVANTWCFLCAGNALRTSFTSPIRPSSPSREQHYIQPI